MSNDKQLTQDELMKLLRERYEEELQKIREKENNKNDESLDETSS